MHNFVVPNRYKYQTRVGNWSEEWELEEVKMKDYMKVKGQGQLNSTIKDQKQTFSLRQASLSLPKDEYLHFGQHAMIWNHKTQGYLGYNCGFIACDIQEKIVTEDEGYAVSTTKITNYPSVRNAFVLQPYTKEPNFFGDDIIHYGQKFRIIANPRLSNKKTFWLHSLPITPSRCAKISRWQEVCVTANDCYNTVWIIRHADPKIRFESEGLPVNISDPVIIEHSFTSQWLASDDIDYQNDFGREKEVFCHSFHSLNKTQNLIAEKSGRTTIDIPMRNQEKQNLWHFILANDPAQNFDEAIIDDNKGVHNLIARIKQQILSKGVYGVRGLSKIFTEMDQNKNGILEYDDFKWGLRNYGIQTAEDETKLLFSSFDTNKNGVIDYNEFISAFRKEPNSFRAQLIENAYYRIQGNAGGVVTLDALGRQINVKKHPEVIKGYKTEREVFKDFVNNWNKAQPDREISFAEFQEYYKDISSSVDKDEFFEALVKNLWGL